MGTTSIHRHNERGQTTVAFIVVVALAGVAIVALSIFAEALIHRARARTAADAVALAAAQDPGAAHILRDWYREQQVMVDHNDARTYAQSGPSQALAWASTEPASSPPAPALPAIMRRAEQVLDVTFSSVQLQSTQVTLESADADIFRLVAHEFGLCEHPARPTENHRTVFELC